MKETTHLPSVSHVTMGAPLEWLAKGWLDFRKVPALCMTHGAGLSLISAGLAAWLYITGAFIWFLVLAGGFLLIAPILAMGAYETARTLDAGRTPRLRDVLLVKSALRGDVVFLGVALFILFGFWIEAAHLVYGLSTSTIHRSIASFLGFVFTTPDGIQMALIGSLVGGAIAFLAYSLVVVSAPMLLDEKTDIFIATITSVRTVVQNFLPMLFWALIILALTAVGIATAFVGLIVVFPWIGLASWHAYRDLVPG